ncbi:MAG TPA: efflux RND transporter periplasmic adaptor subunit [Afifellaceae bacterium]|nr:efflux RND transporter periplasmic adaptor subunit [Afifellaceae bacterium]
MKHGLAILAVATAPGLVFTGGASAADIEIARSEISDLKAVYGQVLSRDVIPARARIAGTIESLQVEEGSRVTAGEVIALVADPKLTLQMQAVEAKIASLEAELTNARDELTRAETLLTRGVTTRQQVDQLRTRLDIVTGQITAARAERAVVEQQMSEGEVTAPATGRVIDVPVTRRSVILAGETIAQVAGGGFFVRLALPERHAALLSEGLEVRLLGRPSEPADERATAGNIVKIYPELSNGQVIADVEATGLDEFYVGERVLVRVPVGSRMAITVPADAVKTRAGVDFVTIRRNGAAHEVSVIPGAVTDDGEVEILTGLAEGDTVILP